MPDASVAPSIPNLIPQAVPFDRILRSAFNPRKHFDPEKVAELADSIASNGLEQNLLVRPHPKKADHFELIGGERRHRAIEKLIAEGRADKARLWPVQVAHYDDMQARIAAIAENMQRADLSEIEQAESFMDLKKNFGLEASAIARQIKINVRTVQKRLKLVTALIPEAIDALREGKIGVEAANAIAVAKREEQAEILDEALEGDVDTDMLKRRATNKLMPVGAQCFALEDYKGELIEFDQPEYEGGPTSWFKDTIEVERLIKAHAEAAKATLAAKFPWVEIKRQSGHTSPPIGWHKGKGKDAGAVIVIEKNTGKMEIHESIVKPKPAARTIQHREPPRAEYDWKFMNAVGNIYDAAIAEAAFDKPAMAARLYAYLEVRRAVNNTTPQGQAAIGKLIGTIAKLPDAALWKRIVELAPGQVLELVGLCFVANENINAMQREYNKLPALKPYMEPVVKAIGADVAKVWEFYGKKADEFLQACGPAQLKRIAQDLGLDLPAGGDEAALRGAIAKNVAANRKYLPPWLHLETADKLAQRLKPPAKAPAAKAKPAPAAKPKGK